MFIPVPPNNSLPNTTANAVATPTIHNGTSAGMVGVATAFAVVIGKEVFGGTGMNIVNVALTARAFLFFAYPTAMSGDKVWKSGTSDIIAQNGGTLPDGASGATALGDAASFVGDAPVVAGEALSATSTSAELLQKFEGA